MQLTTCKYNFSLDTPSGFHIIGKGSIGGKAKGLTLLNGLLQEATQIKDEFPQVRIRIPTTLVIASSVFESFVADNGLEHLHQKNLTDEAVAAEFLNGRMMEYVKTCLGDYLVEHTFPLAVRSSGMLEDAHNHSYAGLYRTYMLSNDQSDVNERLANLVRAVKLVFASTYYQDPKAYAQRVGHNVGAGQMAVIVQQVVGTSHGKYHYPAISGIAQSHNYYPPAGIRPDEGVVTIALGLGQQVVSGRRALRFIPKYPGRLVQRSSVEEVLANAQHHFYALGLNGKVLPDAAGKDHVVRRHISDADEEPPVQMMAGTYVLAEHRIKDTTQIKGPRVLTFASVLKYRQLPLAKILLELLAIGETALGVPVEMEFAVDLGATSDSVSQFHLLQMRPMTASKANVKVTIHPEDKHKALCYTRHAMGNQKRQHISDIVYIKPDAFDPGQTRRIAQQVSEMNAYVHGRKSHYLLVGPGRWGTADPWLGIPVRWDDISNVAAIVETVSDKLNAEPSIGAHFFHNLVSLGISYFSISRNEPDYFDWSWLAGQKVVRETDFVSYVQLTRPVILMVDGKSSKGVIRFS